MKEKGLYLAISVIVVAAIGAYIFLYQPPFTFITPTTDESLTIGQPYIISWAPIQEHGVSLMLISEKCAADNCFDGNVRQLYMQPQSLLLTEYSKGTNYSWVAGTYRKKQWTGPKEYTDEPLPVGKYRLIAYPSYEGPLLLKNALGHVDFTVR